MRFVDLDLERLMLRVGGAIFIRFLNTFSYYFSRVTYWRRRSFSRISSNYPPLNFEVLNILYSSCLAILYFSSSCTTASYSAYSIILFFSFSGDTGL